MARSDIQFRRPSDPAKDRYRYLLRLGRMSRPLLRFRLLLHSRDQGNVHRGVSLAPEFSPNQADGSGSMRSTCRAPPHTDRPSSRGSRSPLLLPTRTSTDRGACTERSLASPPPSLPSRPAPEPLLRRTCRDDTLRNATKSFMPWYCSVCARPGSFTASSIAAASLCVVKWMRLSHVNTL